MIPFILQIKNFLSYGPTVQTIDFSPYQLICLSGKNGHGKSALLDAITWVIWGQARKVSTALKAEGDLIHLGQTQMMVRLDFMCNGQTYRIKREYSKTYGKPITLLDFGIVNKDETVIPLTDKTVRTTQQKIETTINLTYETFSNSAFLRQGHANEFSKKTPKDRKAIFAQILGLERYEAIRKLAMEKAKEATTQKSCLLSFQEKITEELKTSAEVAQQIESVNTQLTDIAKKEKQQLDEQINLIEQKKHLAQQQKKFQQLQFQQEELDRKESTTANNIKAVTAAMQAFKTLQKTMPDQAVLNNEKQNLVAALRDHQKQLQHKFELKEKELRNNTQLQQVQNNFAKQLAQKTEEKKLIFERLRITHEATETILKNGKTQIQKKQNEQNEIVLKKKQINIKLKNYAVDKKTFEALEKKLTAGKEQYQQRVASGNMAKQELTNLHQKQHLSHDDNNPSCPLCEQNLSASRKRFLKTKFQEQQKNLTKKIELLAQELASHKKSLVKQHTLFEQQKKNRDLATPLSIRLEHLEKIEKINKQEQIILKNNIEKTETKKCEIKKELTAASKTLKTHLEQGNKKLLENSEYKNCIKQKEQLQKELKNLKYSDADHKKTVIALEKVEQKINECAQLREQLALQQERKKQSLVLQSDQTLLQKQKIELHNQIKPYDNLYKTEIILHKQEQTLSSDYNQLKKQKEQLLQEKGGLETQQEKLKKLKQEHKTQQKKLCELVQTADDYTDIAAATSKNGIQALLIENAIPEIEQEANKLLSKLTNNQAQIFIESLRDLKKGGTKETLDIKISDSAGIRPYELFSGGEAFRIDFALRIAISKLLARRAGTSLQTLIIDEGFGSQDQEGLALIMDAIHKIQDDFVKIIVVSHLPSMKDQFPVHFMVEKNAMGSRVNIFELA